MNKILALTIFRAAQSDFKKPIGVILQTSDTKDFEKRMDDLTLGFGNWRENIHVFSHSNDKIRGYRLSEILIEGRSGRTLNDEFYDAVIATISSRDHINESRFISEQLGVSANKNWEDQRIFFSE